VFFKDLASAESKNLETSINHVMPRKVGSSVLARAREPDAAMVL
jgi:hypothetical protein